MPEQTAIGGTNSPSLPRPASRPPGWKWNLAAWILLGLVILGAAAIRVRLLDVPFERDEGEYAYMGRLLLEGVPPYLHAYSMKLPGTLAAYALFLATFGESIAGIRLGLILVNGATTALMFLLGRHLLGLFPGLATSVAFACLSLSTGMLSLSAHATHFVLLPAAGGLLIFFRALEERRPALYFTSGLLFGLAVLMKQPGAVYPAWAAFWLAWTRIRGPEADWRKLVRWECSLSLGTFAPIALTVVALALAGVFDRFFFWTVRYTADYATQQTWAAGFGNLRGAASSFLPQGVVFWCFAALGLVMLPISRFGIPRPSLLFTLAVFSFAGVSAGLFYRAHYFILALPAVSLLAGAGFRGLLHLAGDHPARMAAPLVLGAFVAAGCAQTAYSQRNLLFGLPPAAVSRSIYGGNPFPESIPIARYIHDRTRPNDTVAVLGSEPQIFFYSGRRSATGYTCVYGLMEPHPHALGMQKEFIREVEAGAPAYIVSVSVPASWLPWPNSPGLIFEWADTYLPTFYEVVGKVTIRSPQLTEYLWEEDARRKLPGEAPHLLVWRRKPAGQGNQP